MLKWVESVVTIFFTLNYIFKKNEQCCHKGTNMANNTFKYIYLIYIYIFDFEVCFPLA